MEWSIQNVAMAALVGLVSWNVYTTQKLSIEVAVLASTVNSQSTNNYSVVEAESIHRELERAIGRLETRQQSLEDRIKTVEDKSKSD